MSDNHSQHEPTTREAKLAEVERVLAVANYLLHLQGAKAVPCQWKIDAFLKGGQSNEQ